MTTREELPVWAKILLGVPVIEDSECESAVQPGQSPAAARNEDPERATVNAVGQLLRLDRVLHTEHRRRQILMQEAVQ